MALSLVLPTISLCHSLHAIDPFNHFAFSLSPVVSQTTSFLSFFSSALLSPNSSLSPLASQRWNWCKRKRREREWCLGSSEWFLVGKNCCSHIPYLFFKMARKESMNKSLSNAPNSKGKKKHASKLDIRFDFLPSSTMHVISHAQDMNCVVVTWVYITNMLHMYRYLVQS